jgi:NAD(P)-dependent dehydrogenase (short-subunit alcohol dehydrogenase family)
LIESTLPRTALVTGGARRIGRAISLALAGAGFAVAIHYKESREAAEQTLAEVTRIGGKAVLFRANLADEASTTRLIPNACAALGPLGVLVNNASTFERDEWDSVTRQSWDRHLEPNLRAPFVLTQGFAQQLPGDATGVVVNMLDQRVWSLTPHFVSYTVSKAVLWALTKSLALALAPRVRVNALGPGPTLPSSRQSEMQFKKQASSLPLGHGTSPEEIARAVIAILTLPSLTGQMLALDGGQHLQWAARSARQLEVE